MTKEYDKAGNLIYEIDSCGIEHWYEYDKKNIIHAKNSCGFEDWYKYDKDNKPINITENEYKDIFFRKKEKEYNSRVKVSRFELIDI